MQKQNSNKTNRLLLFSSEQQIFDKIVKGDHPFRKLEKILTTPANILDFQVLDKICPSNCMAFMDKLYDVKKSYSILKKNNCHSGIIKKNNNKSKNKDLDRWISSMRMPHEGNFSKLRKTARYKGLAKVHFQCLFEAIAQNLKKAVKILPMELCNN